jgi:FkbM family methyltransferase
MQTDHESVQILPTRGRLLLNAVKAATQFSRRRWGKGLGLWRLIDLSSPLFPNWAECPVVGPDAKPMFLDLRSRNFGIVTQGFDTSHVAPLMAYLDPAAVVLDIGANVGIWTRLFAERANRGQVYAFEPSPDTFHLLVKNCVQHANVECIRTAIGAESGTLSFNENTTTSGLRHLVPGMAAEAFGVIPVTVSSLDDWVRKTNLERIDLVKIDVEGFEEELLNGARETLTRFQPAIVFEYIATFALARSKYQGRKLFRMLKQLSYRVYRLDRHGHMHEDFVIPEEWTNDYLAVPANSVFQSAVEKLAE